jgi:ferredoxin/flavodoxin---NADP+ reductase
MKYNAEVISIEEVSENLRIFRIKPDFPVNSYEAGQYTTLGLDGSEARVPRAQKEELAEGMLNKVQKRAYSISSPVFKEDHDLVDHNELDYLEFYISLVPVGHKSYPPYLTPRLFMLKEGDRVNMGKKITGNYLLGDVDDKDTIIFISTGTGLAPHNPMLSKLLRDGHEGKIVIVECNRYSCEFGYSTQIEEIVESYPNVFHEVMITSEREDYYIQNLFSENVLEDKYDFKIEAKNTKVYLCGSPRMIGAPKLVDGKEVFDNKDGMVSLLQSKYGLKSNYENDEGQINFEKYW